MSSDDHSTTRFTVVPCTLGQVLVAWTDRGLCWVSLGDDAAVLRRELDATVRGSSPAGADPGWLAAVVAAIEDGRPAAVPLDLRGTAFQRRVWAALADIPPGETRTYAELASLLGAPRATRAVGRACASNPVAVLVPCHRVLRADGALSGYRWGPARKAALLARERGAAARCVKGGADPGEPFDRRALSRPSRGCVGGRCRLGICSVRSGGASGGLHGR